MSLHKLPKDILIKIITTIEQDVRNEMQLKQKIFDQIMKIINKDYIGNYIDYHICNYVLSNKTCENYSIESMDNIYFSTSNIFICLNCDKCFCEQHLKDFDYSEEYCNECYIEMN